MCVNKQVKHSLSFLYQVNTFNICLTSWLLVSLHRQELLIWSCTCLHFKVLWQNVLHDNLIKTKWMQEPYLQKWSNWGDYAGLNRDMIEMSMSSTLQMWSLCWWYTWGEIVITCTLYSARTHTFDQIQCYNVKKDLYI